MSSYQAILEKLNLFIKKYYSKMLIKGILLFIVFSALFFFLILGVEHMLWLSSLGRLSLLIAFILVASVLLFTYIIIPLSYLFKLKKGISHKEASVLIGKYFPEVDDKLANLIDLAQDDERSELLLASIHQRSSKLNSVPFIKAIDFKENLKYAKFLAIPFLIICVIWFSGNLSSFFGSADRVVHYDLAYVPPAPFTFKVLTSDLNVLETDRYTVQVTTVGDVKPEHISIVANGKVMVMKHTNGFYQYSFTPPLRTLEFHFIANGIKSKPYLLDVVKVPSINNFDILLVYAG